MRRFLLSLFVISNLAVAARAEPLGLSAAVEEVTTRHPALRSAAAQKSEAEAARSEARMMRLPQLSARSQFTRGDNPVYVFGSLMEQGRFGPSNFAIDQLNHPSDLTNIQSAIELGLPLFTGFELTNAAKMAETSAQAAGAQQSGLAQQLRGQTAQAYLQSVFDGDLLAVLDERLTASQKELADAQRLKDRGLVLGSDYFAAEAIQGGLQAWKIQVQSDQAASLAKLAELTGRAGLETKGHLSDGAYNVPPLAEVTAKALQQRPDLAAAGSQVDLAEINKRQSGYSILPKIEAYAALATNTNDFSYNPANHMFGVAAKLPFGDPAYFAKRQRAGAGVEAAREARAALEEAIRIDVAQAYQGYQGAAAALPVAKDTVGRAQKSLELFRPLYRSGRQSILDVLRAEEGLAKAQAAYLQTQLQVHGGYLQMMAASGGLDAKAVQDVSSKLAVQP